MLEKSIYKVCKAPGEKHKCRRLWGRSPSRIHTQRFSRAPGMCLIYAAVENLTGRSAEQQKSRFASFTRPVREEPPVGQQGAPSSFKAAPSCMAAPSSVHWNRIWQVLWFTWRQKPSNAPTRWSRAHSHTFHHHPDCFQGNRVHIFNSFISSHILLNIVLILHRKPCCSQLTSLRPQYMTNQP